MIANLHPIEGERSAAPEFRGTCGYKILHNHIVIEIEDINNPRSINDISGTLSIEVWALNQAYSGGQFDGLALAGTQIGELRGQHFLSDCRYSLQFREPPVGTWHLVLMLREWTDNGFITRDFVNFGLPYTVNAAPAQVPDNVVSINFKPAETNPKTTKETVLPQQQPSVESNAPKPVVSPGTKTHLISLNRATVKEIAAIKGISLKLANSIVAGRPYADIDQLQKIKGLGGKTLASLRQFVTL